MLTHEEFMDVLALRRQGWTIEAIAAETGYHPATISVVVGGWSARMAFSPGAAGDPSMKLLSSQHADPTWMGPANRPRVDPTT